MLQKTKYTIWVRFEKDSRWENYFSEAYLEYWTEDEREKAEEYFQEILDKYPDIERAITEWCFDEVDA